MKSKFIFIHCKDALTPDTTVYFVYIGVSKQEQRDLKFFQALSFSHDYYFKRYDASVADFLYNIKMQFARDGNIVPDVPPIRKVTSSQLRKMVLSGTFSKSPLPKGYSYDASVIDLQFRINQYKQGFKIK